MFAGFVVASAGFAKRKQLEASAFYIAEFVPTTMETHTFSLLHPNFVWPREFILAEKIYVVRVSSCSFRRAAFGVQLSACSFRRAGFGAIVSATSNCLVRKRHIFVFGNDKLSSVGMTHCPVWTRPIVLCENDTLFCVGTTHCPLWTRHNVLCGNNTLFCVGVTLSCVEMTRCPVWTRNIVL